MKSVLLTTLAIVCGGLTTSVLGTAGPVAGPGSWTLVGQSSSCESGRVCAEWYEPEGQMNGAVCCIQSVNISSTSFYVCEVLLRDPRPDGNNSQY